jgi:putative ABC transport system permease protein
MLEFSAERAPEWLRRLCIDAQVAGRNVLRQRRRSALGVIAVTFGVMSMLLAGGFIEWILWATREATIKGGLGHIQVVRPGLLDGGLADPYSFLLPERGREREVVEKAPGVQAVAATLSFSGLASFGEATLSFLGDGVDVRAQRFFSEVNILPGGATLSAEDPKGIVMGRGLAENLGAKVGDVVVLLATTGSGGINAVEARIRGLFFTVSKAYDDSAVRVPLALAQQLVRTAQVHRWIVVLDDTERTAAAAAALRAQLPSAGLEVVPWHRLADFYNKTFTLLSRQVNVVVIIIAAIIVLSISNTLTMAVMERTGEVGTSMALGVTRGRILVRFLAEGALLGVIGGGVGALLGVACAWAISAVGIPMPPPPGMSEGYLGRILVTGELVWHALLLAVATTLVASVYPAWKASRLVIVDALRHNR